MGQNTGRPGVRTSPTAAVSRWTVGDGFELACILLAGYGLHLFYNFIGYLASLRGVDFGPSLLGPIDRAIPFVPFLVHFYQVAYVAPLVAILLLIVRVGPDM